MREFLAYWNSRELLEAFTEISGQKIVRASAQATCYDKANFLTRHNDVVPSEGRVYAYVLGMTEKWHPDWGGLLQFYRQDGTPTESHAPAHNSLTLFDVRKIHAVTYVAPFANARRYSITGWFRTR
jgi:Rps23 Pro-64 3,4-dihydroxylase Tpa1-like proline 4-hydroxylase